MKNFYSIRSISLAFLFFNLLAISSCKKENDIIKEPVTEQKLPEVSTLQVSNVGYTKVSIGGKAYVEDGPTIIERGFCLSLKKGPTVNDKKFACSLSGATFSIDVNALIPDTRYYLRAYAVNSVGTAYGNEISFVTLKNADGTVVDADGNVYHVVKIGTQYWLKENLKTETYMNGDSIKQWSEEPVGGYCYLGNALSRKDEVGCMYNWYAATDNRKVTPTGWHVPSTEEWQTLIDYVGGETQAGGKLKETGNAFWNIPNDASDDFGFSARGGGYRLETGGFFGTGGIVIFMTHNNSAGTSDDVMSMLNTHTSTVKSIFPKRGACYIRCIKD